MPGSTSCASPSMAARGRRMRGFAAWTPSTASSTTWWSSPRSRSSWGSRGRRCRCGSLPCATTSRRSRDSSRSRAAGATTIHLQRLVYTELGMATHEQSRYGRLQEREAAAIREAETTARAEGLHFSASGATAPEVSLTPAPAGQPWSACRRPWTLAYVTVSGNVLPCCIAPWITGHYDGIILGNLYRESLEEVWWGKRYADFRRDLQTAEPPEPCRGCGVKWSL